jgi:hypothetical protein
VRAVAAAVLAALLTQSPQPQNPSPMTETTRPHPRVAEYEAKGTRRPVGRGTLFLRDGLRAVDGLTLLVHFHGAPWLIEHHISRLRSPIVLLTFQLGSGSGVYGSAFSDPAAFASALHDAAAAASSALGRTVQFDRVVLASFSAGYGAVRAILRHPEHYDRISTVVLADSLHASYATPAPVGPRAQDLAVNAADLDVFLTLAADAAAGRKQLIVWHSEVFPGTYASTTETADALLAHVGLRRRANLGEGPLGMQRLSESRRGRFAVMGYAGNSAPDHLDHLYALGEFLERVRP